MTAPQPAEICVVVTAYNYGRYITRCIQSVLQQVGAPKWHLVVVDDGSTDETSNILKAYGRDPRITLICLAGKGLAGSGNAGVSNSASDWVLRLDADDWLEPDALRKLYEHAKASGADFVYGDLLLVDEAGRSLGVLSQADEWLGSGLERSPVGSGALYRRAVWETVGGYDETLRYQEDFDFWLKVVEQFKASHIPQAVYVYRQHFSSMSGNRKPRAASRALVKRRALLRRALPHTGKLLAVISAIPTLCARIDPKMCMMFIDGERLIERAIRAVTEIGYEHEIVVECAAAEIETWARSKGLRTAEGAASYSISGDSIQPLLDLPRNDEMDVVLHVSPYFPLVETYRYREVIDTLFLGNCSRVDTAIADAARMLVPGEGGWKELPGAASVACLPGGMRTEGGLTALRTGKGGNKRGCVEIAWPENHMVRDSLTLKAAERLRLD